MIKGLAYPLIPAHDFIQAKYLMITDFHELGNAIPARHR
jgi:hypothetical protein